MGTLFKVLPHIFAFRISGQKRSLHSGRSVAGGRTSRQKITKTHHSPAKQNSAHKARLLLIWVLAG